MLVSMHAPLVCFAQVLLAAFLRLSELSLAHEARADIWIGATHC